MKTKNLKALATILLTLTLLILAASAISVPSVKAATTTNLVLYQTLGLSSVDANGTALTAGSSNATSNQLTSGNTYTFTATASSGYKFIGWAYADASGAVGSTSATFTHAISGTACSLEALFVPTTNTTVTPSGSGSASLVVFTTAGGTTSPTGGLAGTSTTGTVGTAKTFTETTLSGYTFLCWVVQCSQNNYYTSSTLSYTPVSTSGAAIEALWIPTNSGIVLPTVTTSPSATPTPKPTPEYSSAIIIAIVAALVAVAAATVVAKKNRK